MPQIIYRWLALLALAGTLLAFGWIKGASHEQAKVDAANLSATARAAIVRQRRAETTVQVLTKYVDRVRTVHVAGETIIKEVPVYVPSDSPALPGGFRVHHDAAALGELPDPALGELPDPARVADAAAVPAQDVAATVAANYLTCHENAEQLTALQEWVREQSQVR
ncbi:hypothetical protein C8E02_1012 [Vogesella indigofera]|uniref:Uncharacterized protein n=1 Tax=Vogesella indigofera TaxID=45465 RepID=A0A495BJL7_VOGIN|nr:hypothetical protein [Vogesella indigofera]RKQ61245.1 hypothetical protein C8E02_1012 [Vogesella indigofera]